MGASSSTIKDTIRATFARVDVGKKGYLTLKEVLRLPHIWGIDPGHLGVLWAVDRDRDGLINQEEALTFAQHATGLSRGLKARDTLTAGALTQGHCSLAMWRALQQPGGRAAFVGWVVRLITHGAEAALSPGWEVACVGPAAVKNLYQLFDMERRQGLLLEEFSDLLLSAAAEHGLVCALQEPSEPSSPSEADSASGDGEADRGEGDEEGASSKGGVPGRGGSALGAAGPSRAGEQGGAAAGSWGGQQEQRQPAPPSPAQQRPPPAQGLQAQDENGRGGGPGGGGGDSGGAASAREQQRAPLPAVPLDVVEDFLDAAFDGMGGVVDSIVDVSELREALEDEGGSGGGGGGMGLLAPRALVLG